MAAHVSTHRPRPHGLIVRIKALIGRFELDRELAAGVDPSSTPELERRAHVLRGWRARHRLADGLESVVVEAVAPPHDDHGADVPVQREEVLAAQRDLLRLIAALRSEPAPPVRGIAAAELLLTDGAGPVFAPCPRGTLSQAAFQAAFQAEAG